MRSLKRVHIAGAVFTLIAGSLLHFTWDWSGHRTVVALFSAVSESTWEHLKLLFVPFILFTIVEYILYGKDKSCFFAVKARSVLWGMLTVVTAFYTYTGILGNHYLLLDIGTFVLGVVVAYVYSYRHLHDAAASCSVYAEAIGIFTLAALAVAFAVFTFVPPSFGLFLSPTA